MADDYTSSALQCAVKFTNRKCLKGLPFEFCDEDFWAGEVSRYQEESRRVFVSAPRRTVRPWKVLRALAQCRLAQSNTLKGALQLVHLVLQSYSLRCALLNTGNVFFIHTNSI